MHYSAGTEQHPPERPLHGHQRPLQTGGRRSGMEIYELLSLSTVGSTSKLASDWLHKSEQSLRGQVSTLIHLLTMTTTHKFPPQVHFHPDYQKHAGEIFVLRKRQGWKFMSYSHCQELGQIADLASDWLFVQPIRSQLAC